MTDASKVVSPSTIEREQKYWNDQNFQKLESETSRTLVESGLDASTS